MMDLTCFPFDVPVILQSVRKGTNLQNPIGSSIARCLVDNRDLYEQLFIHQIGENQVAIESDHSGLCLQVSASGDCSFEAIEPEDASLFTLETDTNGSLYLVFTQSGKALQCDDNNVVKCADHNRRGSWEAWRIVEPRAAPAPLPVKNGLPVKNNQTRALVGRDRQDFIFMLVNHGTSVDDIEQIVTRLFDAPAAAASNTSPYAVPVNKA